MLQWRVILRFVWFKSQHPFICDKVYRIKNSSQLVVFAAVEFCHFIRFLCQQSSRFHIPISSFHAHTFLSHLYVSLLNPVKMQWILDWSFIWAWCGPQDSQCHRIIMIQMFFVLIFFFMLSNYIHHFMLKWTRIFYGVKYICIIVKIKQETSKKFQEEIFFCLGENAAEMFNEYEADRVILWTFLFKQHTLTILTHSS